jgi:hypothetical protein
MPLEILGDSSSPTYSRDFMSQRFTESYSRNHLRHISFSSGPNLLAVPPVRRCGHGRDWGREAWGAGDGAGGAVWRSRRLGALASGCRPAPCLHQMLAPATMAAATRRPASCHRGRASPGSGSSRLAALPGIWFEPGRRHARGVLPALAAPPGVCSGPACLGVVSVSLSPTTLWSTSRSEFFFN